MKTALLLIDIQNDYFPGGKMELEGPIEAAHKANELLQCFRDHSLPTVHIQHVSIRPGATFFLPGERGTDINDIVETAALHKVLGSHAKSVAVSSTKSMHGHALGAAGALELAATLGAIAHQTAPPTANFTQPDPDLMTAW